MSRAERIAFVCPRFPEGGTVGGAETLLRNLAQQTALAGRSVTFLTTCAQSHFTWENTLPPGRRTVGSMQVEFFPVDDRDLAKRESCEPAAGTEQRQPLVEEVVRNLDDPVASDDRIARSIRIRGEVDPAVGVDRAPLDMGLL